MNERVSIAICGYRGYRRPKRISCQQKGKGYLHKKKVFFDEEILIFYTRFLLGLRVDEIVFPSGGVSFHSPSFIEED